AAGPRPRRQPAARPRARARRGPRPDARHVALHVALIDGRSRTMVGGGVPPREPRLLLRRRDVLRGVTLLVAGAAARVVPARATPSHGLASDGTFPTGVLAGDASHHGVTLLARVAGVEPGARVGVEVARDPAFAHVLHRRLVPVAAVPGDIARVRV